MTLLSFSPGTLGTARGVLGLGTAWSQLMLPELGLGMGARGRNSPGLSSLLLWGSTVGAQAASGCAWVSAGSATHSLEAFGVSWDGAVSKQGSERLGEASQSEGGCKGTDLSAGTRARWEWAAPSLAGRAAAGQEGLLRDELSFSGLFLGCRWRHSPSASRPRGLEPRQRAEVDPVDGAPVPAAADREVLPGAVREGPVCHVRGAVLPALTCLR